LALGGSDLHADECPQGEKEEDGLDREEKVLFADEKHQQLFEHVHA
jgi:hypothetical protein